MRLSRHYTPRHRYPSPAAGLSSQVTDRNRIFYAHYRSLGGRNGHWDITGGGGNDWGTWAAQLGAMAGDIRAALG